MYYQQCCQKLPLSQHRARRSQASGARSDGLAWGTGYPASSVRRAAKAGTARSAALQPRAPPGGQQPRRGRLGARGPLGRRRGRGPGGEGGPPAPRRRRQACPPAGTPQSCGRGGADWRPRAGLSPGRAADRPAFPAPGGRAGLSTSREAGIVLRRGWFDLRTLRAR